MTAFKWWRLAADKGHRLAIQAVMQAEELMTLAQVKRAERLPEAWKSENAQDC